MLVMSSFSLLIVVSASSWWMIWFGMEMFMLFFIPFMKLDSWKGANSGLWHYFVIQSVSSIMLLLFSVMFSNYEFFNFPGGFGPCLKGMIVVPVLMKLGLPPFHSWILSVSFNLSWTSFFFMNFMSKISPLVFAANLINCNFLEKEFVFCMSLTIMFLVIYGVKSSHIRHLLVYSGMISQCWMFLAMEVKISMFLIYLVSYFMSLWIITMNLNLLKVETLHQSASYWGSIPFFTKLIVLLATWNICSVPPSPLFIIKVNIIMSCFEQSWLLGFISVMISLIYLKAYLFNISVIFNQLNPQVSLATESSLLVLGSLFLMMILLSLNSMLA